MIDRDLLKRMLSGRVVVACVGNNLRGDEAAGPLVASFVRPTSRLTVIDCGETPENYLGVIARLNPEKVIVVDAADFGGGAGDVRIAVRQEIGGYAIPTYAPRLTTFTDYVEAQTGAETFYITIQPESVEFGGSMGCAVARAARELALAINDVLEADPGGERDCEVGR
jgi:hydrogenase 3 maturation protease